MVNNTSVDNCVFYLSKVSDISLDDTKPVRNPPQPSEIFLAACSQHRIENGDVKTICKQISGETRSDEPSSAGHQNSFAHGPPSLRFARRPGVGATYRSPPSQSGLNLALKLFHLRCRAQSYRCCEHEEGS